MARPQLLAYRWPREVGFTRFVLTSLGALALVAIAIQVVDQGPMCGEVRMSAGDGCYVGGSDSPASASDIKTGPVLILILGAVALVIWLVVRIRRGNEPTEPEIRAFRLHVALRRDELLRIYYASPDCQAMWSTSEDLLALFDKQVDRELKRKGLSAT